MNRLVPLALSTLIAGASMLAPHDASATVVTGVIQIDAPRLIWTPTDHSVVTPMDLPPIDGADSVARFTYDTERAQVVTQSATFARYNFSDSLSLSVTVNGYVYSVTATAQNPIMVTVGGGGPHVDSFFSINWFNTVRIADPENPLQAFPRLSFNLSEAGNLSSPALPTSSFSLAGFHDGDIWLESVAPRTSPERHYEVEVLYGRTATLTTVPEPPAASLVWLLGLGGLMAFGGGIAARRDAA